VQSAHGFNSEDLGVFPPWPCAPTSTSRLGMARLKAARGTRHPKLVNSSGCQTARCSLSACAEPRGTLPPTSRRCPQPTQPVGKMGKSTIICVHISCMTCSVRCKCSAILEYIFTKLAFGGWNREWVRACICLICRSCSMHKCAEITDYALVA